MSLSIAPPKPRNSSRAAKAASPSRETADQSELEIALPPAHDWRTTDEDEINRRRKRAREESFVIRNTEP
jgi:hypothetical protein